MTWTQPICTKCYMRRHPYRVPVVAPFTEYGEETCCDCGKRNKDGLYIRTNPKYVRHPKTLMSSAEQIPMTPMLEDEAFMKWWDKECEKYPSDNRMINVLHLAQAAYAAWSYCKGGA